jgi:FG-GAP-like repeat/FG-GAP repeat
MTDKQALQEARRRWGRKDSVIHGQECALHKHHSVAKGDRNMPFPSLSNAFDRQSQPTQRADGAPAPSRRGPFRPRLEGLEDRCLPSFGPALSFPTGIEPRAVALGDFNGDGKLDLAVADHFGTTRPGGPVDGTLSVLPGNGDGTFGPAVSYPSVTHPNDVAVGDLNGDGKLDIVVANEGGTVSVFLGKGDGTFLPPVSYAAGFETSRWRSAISTATASSTWP